MKRVLVLCCALLLPALAVSADDRTLNIGLTIPDPLAARLEQRLDTALSNMPAYSGVRVYNISSYDTKHLSVLNKGMDIIDAGYGVYREALAKGSWSVILHACYYGDNQQMFYSDGVIISADPSIRTLDDIRGRPVFAVSPSSATGWQLQTALLERIGLDASAVTFVKEHRLVAPTVATNPGSVGFCGGFCNISGRGLAIIARTQRVPSALIIARENIDETLLAETTQIIKDFFLDEYRKDPTFIRRFFVYPLETDYRRYLDAFGHQAETTATPWLYPALIALVLVLAATLCQLRQRSRKSRLQSTGYDDAAAELARGPFASGTLRTTTAVFDETVRLLSREEWRAAIVRVTRDLDRIMPDLANRINALPVSDNWKLPLFERMDTWTLIASFNKRVIGQLRVLMARSRQQNDARESYRDILSPEELDLVPLAAIDGLLVTLYGYRDLATQAHLRFCDAATARHVFDTWLALQRALAASRLFA